MFVLELDQKLIFEHALAFGHRDTPDQSGKLAFDNDFVLGAHDAGDRQLRGSLIDRNENEDYRQC